MEKYQKRVKEFCSKYNMDSPAEHRLLDLISELGEVAKEILKMSDYGKKPLEYKNEITSEIGDTLFALIALANTLDIDLNEALDMVIDKYEKRLLKGSADSEND